MKANKFYSALLKSIKKRNDIAIRRYKLNYKRGRYGFIKILSKKITPQDKIILIRAGIHGEEIAGPITILQNINQIIDHVHQNNLKIILYPLGNPSGFESGLRYNIDNDKGPVGNNDFLRYELENGRLVDDIGESNQFKKWYWASEKKLKVKLPKETMLMHKLLKKDPLSQIVAFVDLHQDYLTPNAPPAAYHYSSGNLKIYKEIVGKIEQILPLFKNKYIGAGYRVQIDKSGKVIGKPVEEETIKSDNQGFIIRHDGGLGDLMSRLGTPLTVDAETTGATPLNLACQVNLLWIFGIVEIIKKLKLVAPPNSS